MKSFEFFAAFLLLPSALLAGANRWTSSGPDVGAVNRVYSSPQSANEAFVVTAAGLYKTTDGGQSWRPANEGLPSSSTSNFVAATDRTLYVSIADRVFASDDGGEHWYQRGSPALLAITALAFDPVSKTLIAGTRGVAGIYVSADGGQTWKRSEVHSADAALIGIDFIVVSATAAYARVSSSWVLLRSADAGNTWQPINVSASDLFTDPSTSWVYARSLDGKSLTVSKDEARTWTNLPSRSDVFFKLVAAGTSAYVLTGSGVFVYSDGERSWQTLTSIAVTDFAISSSTPRHFYVAPRRGVITGVEGAVDWVPSNTGLPGATASDVDLAISEPSTAYAATDEGVFRTDDGGQNWASIYASSHSDHVAVSPATPDTAFISAGVLLRTSDRGRTWKQVTPRSAEVLAIAPSDPKTLYAAFTSGMAKSTDGGDTWDGIGSGLDYNFYYYSGPGASSIAVDPSNAMNALTGIDSGIFKTTTGGAPWRQVSPEALVPALTIDPSDFSTFFAGKSTTGLLRSNDGGASWAAAGLSDKHVATLAMQAASLYAGTSDGHIYRSDDRGQSWIGFDARTNFGSVRRVVADLTATHLYAATSAGVYQYEIVGEDIKPLRLDADPLRLPHLLDGITGSPQQNAALIIPIVGSVRGVGGTTFTTELMLSNANESPQTVRVTWLPRGGDGDVTSFELTIPSASDRSGGTVKFLNFGESFSKTGVGSLIVAAVNTAGNIDTNASIDASVRVWSAFADGRAPVSQAIPEARSDLLATHNVARLAGLRHDALFRTNFGIVNLADQPRQFTIQIDGERSNALFTIEVPPFSVVQTSLPDGDYGTLALNVFAGSADARWLLCGTTIDRTSGEAQTSLGTPSQ